MKKTSNRLHSLFAALAALVLAAALAVPAFAVEGGFADLYYRMFDDAEVLTEDEDNELEDALEELSLRQSFDVTIATIESMESVGADSMEQFADDLYDYLFPATYDFEQDFTKEFEDSEEFQAFVDSNADQLDNYKEEYPAVMRWVEGGMVC